MEEPKKPQNPYWMFLSENRADMMKECGSGHAPVLGKFAGAKWKAMTGAQKAPFEKRASDAKVAYEKALEEFKAQGGVSGKRKQEKADKKTAKTGKRAKKERDANQPKKPQSSYWLWLAENRAALTKEVGSSITAVAETGGARWKAP